MASIYWDKSLKSFVVQAQPDWGHTKNWSCTEEIYNKLRWIFNKVCRRVVFKHVLPGKQKIVKGNYVLKNDDLNDSTHQKKSGKDIYVIPVPTEKYDSATFDPGIFGTVEQEQ